MLKKLKYTKQVVAKLETFPRGTRIAELEDTTYLHCMHCMKDIPKDKSPKEFMSYYARTIKIPIDDEHSVKAIGIFCKHCDRHIWDSRHLSHAY